MLLGPVSGGVVGREDGSDPVEGFGVSEGDVFAWGR